ncbi:leucine-rich repeat-containing protein 24-like [Centruroides vittatus]|uniref:leucine-rich repeat-containing protein 24-like n=1 Tax=Centruroides vittatus TaxID=120091 RepID=UPI00350FFED8
MTGWLPVNHLSWMTVTCVILTLTVSSSGFPCHPKCNCIWRNGKQTAECPNLGFDRLPMGLDPGVQVLYLSRNNLTFLPPNGFLAAGLVNLQRLYLSRCGIEIVDEYALYRITNLIELDLSENLLLHVPSVAFNHVPLLRHLLLNSNPISFIPAQAFIDLKALTILEMSNCKLESIAARAFEGLEKLEVLKLDGNNLENVHGKTMLPLVSLHGITIDGNPWRCDCDLRSLRLWLDTNNVPYIPPICYRPVRLKGRSWRQVTAAEYACPPVFLNTTSARNVLEGDNVTLECRLGGDPLPDIHWLWKGRVLTNNSEPSLFISISRGEREKVSRLLVISVHDPYAGYYTCIAENIAGLAAKNFTIMITRKKVTGVNVIEEEKTQEVKEEETPKEDTGPVAGLIVGVVLGALLIIICIAVGMYICRRPPPIGKRLEVNHKLANSVSPATPHVSTEDMDLQLLGISPLQKPPRGYEGLPTSEVDRQEASSVNDRTTPRVWLMKETIASEMSGETYSSPSPEEEIRTVPVPVLPEILHVRLHGELMDTLKKKADKKILERERGDGSSEMEVTDHECNKIELSDDGQPSKETSEESGRDDSSSPTSTITSDSQERSSKVEGLSRDRPATFQRTAGVSCGCDRNGAIHV